MSTVASLSERIADGIVAMIEADDLGPGDALLSSRELAHRFEVTTPTVREALRRLEATDVIRFRHGSGTYVSDGIGRRVLANRHARGGGLASVLELIDSRIVLEPQIAEAAAEARTAEHLADLEQSSDNALKPQVGHERPDVHFHVAIAAATGNALVRETIEALLQVRSSDQVEIRHRYRNRARDHAEHLDILTAIRDRDAQAAGRLTREHLLSIRQELSGTGREDAS